MASNADIANCLRVLAEYAGTDTAEHDLNALADALKSFNEPSETMVVARGASLSTTEYCCGGAWGDEDVYPFAPEGSAEAEALRQKYVTHTEQRSDMEIVASYRGVY